MNTISGDDNGSNHGGKGNDANSETSSDADDESTEDEHTQGVGEEEQKDGMAKEPLVSDPIEQSKHFVPLTSKMKHTICHQ